MLAHHYLTALELARAAGNETPELVERARVALRDAGDRAASLNAFAAAGASTRAPRALAGTTASGRGSSRSIARRSTRPTTIGSRAAIG